MKRELSPIFVGLVLLGACDDESTSAKPEPVAMTNNVLRRLSFSKASATRRMARVW